MFQLHKTLKQDMLENNYFLKIFVCFPLQPFLSLTSLLHIIFKLLKKIEIPT